MTDWDFGRFTSASAQDTLALGRRLGAELPDVNVVLVDGPLGIGKTVLIKGIVASITGVDENEVSSPSFTLVNEYGAKGRVRVAHIDLYRLDDVADDDLWMFEEYLFDSSWISIVEWGGKLPDGLVDEYLRIQIASVSGLESNGRSIDFSGQWPSSCRSTWAIP